MVEGMPQAVKVLICVDMAPVPRFVSRGKEQLADLGICEVGPNRTRAPPRPPFVHYIVSRYLTQPPGSAFLGVLWLLTPVRLTDGQLIPCCRTAGTCIPSRGPARTTTMLHDGLLTGPLHERYNRGLWPMLTASWYHDRHGRRWLSGALGGPAQFHA